MDESNERTIFFKIIKKFIDTNIRDIETHSIDIYQATIINIVVAEVFFLKNILGISFEEKMKVLVNESTKIIVDHIQCYGNEMPLSLYGGLSQISLSINLLSQNTGEFNKLSEQIDCLLQLRLDKTIDQSIEDIIYLNEYYDFISGELGVASYLIFSETGMSTLTKILDKYISAWWSTKNNNNILTQGIAHGIAGFLSILCKAWNKGIRVDRQKETIKSVLKKILENEENNFSRQGWCQGSLGITRIIYVAAILLNDKILSDKSHQKLKIFSLDKRYEKEMYSPTLCHGYAAAYSILTKQVADSKDEELAQSLISLRTLLLHQFDYKTKYGFIDKEFKSEFDSTIIDSSDSYSILNGSSGIILALLSVNRKINSLDCLLAI